MKYATLKYPLPHICVNPHTPPPLHPPTLPSAHSPHHKLLKNVFLESKHNIQTGCGPLQTRSHTFGLRHDHHHDMRSHKS